MSFGVVTMSNEYLATKGKRNITRLSQKLNIYDLIEIKTCKEVEVWQQVVVHLLIQIWSHLLKKSLPENFIFCAVSFHYRRLPFLKGGLQISCVIETKLIGTNKIKKSIQIKYSEIVQSVYLELKSEEIITFRSCGPEVFCEKGVLRNFTKFTGKTPVPEYPFRLSL